MATVATKLTDGQRRIITKVIDGQRRVSCSCCEAGCCMYPAAELGNRYVAEDLPDAVTVNWAGRFTGSMTKSGSGYAGGGATLEVVNDIWRLSDTGGDRNVGRCLVIGNGNLTQGDDLVEDQFADTYTVERRTETLTGPPDATYTITRESLCRWCGFDPLRESTICLEYNPPTFAGQGHWAMDGFGEATPRNNSSPVGNYNDGGSIWMVLEP
jgi:uncharacterized protein CbrC (UPF0167 family)